MGCLNLPVVCLPASALHLCFNLDQSTICVCSHRIGSKCQWTPSFTVSRPRHGHQEAAHPVEITPLLLLLPLPLPKKRKKCLHPILELMKLYNSSHFCVIFFLWVTLLGKMLVAGRNVPVDSFFQTHLHVLMLIWVTFFRCVLVTRSVYALPLHTSPSFFNTLPSPIPCYYF